MSTPFLEPAMASTLPGAGWPDPHSAPAASTPASKIQVVNWATLSADRAKDEWASLDAFVDQLRADYGLPPTIIPPLWHRHWELVWELSALHTYWRHAYAPDAGGTQPLMFHRFFAEARNRLREWVATCGSKLDTDRPTRLTAWPGEPARLPEGEHPILDRRADFNAWVAQDVARRRATQQQTAALGGLVLETEAGVA
jgi:hypothetical protein